MVSLSKVPYKVINYIFTHKELEPKIEKLKSNILNALQRDDEKPHSSIKNQYNIGSQVLLIKDYCEQCLALQYPYGTVVKYDLPKEFAQNHYDKNKAVTLDEYGITKVSNINYISHAKCCPMNISPLKEVEDILNMESNIDEHYLDNDLIDKVAISYKFALHNLWHLEAYIFGKSYIFYALTKALAIEKLYIFILKNFYNYSNFGIGLTIKSAYTNYLSNVKRIEGFNQGLIVIDLHNNELFNSLDFKEEIVDAKLFNQKTPFNISYLQVLTQSGTYSSIASTLEDCLVDVWIQLENKEHFICNRNSERGIDHFNIENTLELLQYEDALSKKYKFIVLGADNSV